MYFDVTVDMYLYLDSLSPSIETLLNMHTLKKLSFFFFIYIYVPEQLQFYWQYTQTKNLPNILFIFLLFQNDCSFIDSIHKAYLSSLQMSHKT